MNANVYSDEVNALVLFNKMSKERGRDFSEGWYMKILDSTIPAKNKDYQVIIKDFIIIFYPYNLAAKARVELANLKQNLRDRRDGFNKYVLEFLLLAAKTGFKEDTMLIEWFI
ncbi:hypothetical protein J3R83DRAFT_176 [Lanmaoa asiatica]|nr:hypothetical protein J3R83DRAFT_176 [Lanmaoa asiatica]